MAVDTTSQHKGGKNVEAYLDDFFRHLGWQITQTTVHEERVLHLGDRRFRKADVALLIEYKSGIQTAVTGNIFLETISVDSQNIPGWVYTCQADLILYAAVLNNKILVFRPKKLREVIEGLKRQFRVVKTGKQQNKGYDTHGVIVPLTYAERYLAETIIEI